MCACVQVDGIKQAPNTATGKRSTSDDEYEQWYKFACGYFDIAYRTVYDDVASAGLATAPTGPGGASGGGVGGLPRSASLAGPSPSSAPRPTASGSGPTGAGLGGATGTTQVRAASGNLNITAPRLGGATAGGAALALAASASLQRQQPAVNQPVVLASDATLGMPSTASRPALPSREDLEQNPFRKTSPAPVTVSLSLCVSLHESS